jgi:predicted MFS family arabinose efflux permease
MVEQSSNRRVDRCAHDGNLTRHTKPAFGQTVRVTKRFHYAWVVLGAGVLVLVLGAGFRSGIAVMIEPLQQAKGWSRGQVSIAAAISVMLYGLMGPFSAALIGRYGLRRVIPAALVCIAVGGAVSSLATQVWHLWLAWGVLVGIGSGALASVMGAVIANRWFYEKRGLASGAFQASVASGQIVFLQVLTRLVDSRGWRAVPIAIGIAALLAVPVVLVIRNKPEDVGLRAYGAPTDYRTPDPQLNPIATAFRGLGIVSRSGAFWLLFGSFMVCGISTNGLIGTHFLSAAHDHGFTGRSAASYLTAIGVLDIIGTLSSGWLTDRIDPRRLLFFYYGLRGLSLFTLEHALSSGKLPLWGFIAFYGLDWVATVPPTIRLCADVCGPEYATIGYGWVFAGHQVGASLAAWGAGFLRDTHGTYSAAWTISGVVCIVAAFGVLRINRTPIEPIGARSPGVLSTLG